MKRPFSRTVTLRRAYENLPYMLAGLFWAALLVYSVTRAFIWDEGFHLLAAQMIADGKRPYLDFCFPQTPLNAYWNAALLRVFGNGWRVPHAFAATFVAATVFLLAHYLLTRLPAGRWRVPCATAAVLFLALSPIVVQFGPMGQAYGLGLFAAFTAFQLWTIADSREGYVLPFLSGFAGGVAAGCTLLTAPVIPVLFLAFVFKRGRPLRWRQALAFLAGLVPPFAPVIILFVADPHVVFFNIVQYQAIFRRYHWDNAGPHDFDVLTSWADSNQTFLLVLLSIATASQLRRADWDIRFRRELTVAALLVLCVTAYISTAHPTFSRYYVVEVPFLAVLAGPGLRIVASRLLSPVRSGTALAFVAFVLIVTIARTLYNDRDAASFTRYQELSKKILEVTPPHAEFFADEHIYFLLHRTPPSGMEFSYSHKLELPAAEERRLHIISEKELQSQLKNGRFATYESCKDEQIDDWGIEKIFSHQAEVADCTVFWGFHK